MNKQATERNPFWDSLKFILIFFVVYGHMIETCVDYSPFNQAIYNFIYLFHMPLFVFISGRFSHIMDRQKYLIRTLTIFETYIVFQFLRCSKPILSEGYLSLFPNLLIPKGILWYLACLILWRIIVYIMTDCLLERIKWLILSVFFISGLGIGFIMVPNGTLIRVFTLGLFFFIGYYIKDSQIESLFQRIPVHTTLFLISFIWFLVFIYLDFDIRSVIYFGSYYDNLPIPPLNYLGARVFLYVFAVIVGFLLMRIIYAKPLFSNYGIYTLAIFMYHIIFVQALRPLFASGTIPPNEALLFAISIILCFSLAWLTQHFKIMNIMLNPITYIISKYKSNKK